MSPNRPRSWIAGAAAARSELALVLLLLFPLAVIGQELPRVERSLAVGTLDGEPWEALGHVPAASVLADGRIVALDRQANTIYVYTPSGELARRIGRAGAGPGEFRVPAAIHVDAGRLHVLDRANTRISTFDVETGDLISDVRIDVDAHDVCSTNGGFVLLGWANRAALHLLDAAGARLSSVGESLLRDPLFAAHGARGHLLCHGDGTRFTHVADILPTVRQMDRSGRVVWSTTLPGFAPMSITRGDLGGARLGPPADPERDWGDVNVSLVELPGGRLLVQFGSEFLGLGSREDIVEVTSVILDARTGEIIATGQSLPRVGASKGLHLLSHHNDPFPRLVRYRLLGAPDVGGWADPP